MNHRSSRRQFLGAAGLLSGAATAQLLPASIQAASAEKADSRPHWFGYALNTATIRGQKLGLAEQIEAVIKAGYQGFEPWTGDLAKFAETGGSLKDLAKRCQDAGLAVVSAIGFAPWVVDDDAQRAKGVEQMKREMDLLAQLGGTHIAAPPSGATKAGNKLDLDRAAERYRVILEAGRQIGVNPQIEVWGSSPNLNHVAEAVYVAARAGHPNACVLADAFHMYKAGVEPASLRLLSRSVVHCFHLNDYPAQPPRAAIKDSERIWPGDGIAPLKEILKIFAANHCRIYLSLELFNPDYYRLPAAEAARTGLEKMKAVVAAAALG